MSIRLADLDCIFAPGLSQDAKTSLQIPNRLPYTAVLLSTTQYYPVSHLAELKLPSLPVAVFQNKDLVKAQKIYPSISISATWAGNRSGDWTLAKPSNWCRVAKLSGGDKSGDMLRLLVLRGLSENSSFYT